MRLGFLFIFKFREQGCISNPIFSLGGSLYEELVMMSIFFNFLSVHSPFKC